jgi:amino acid transporter
MKDAIMTAIGICAVIYLVGIFALIVGLGNAIRESRKEHEDGQEE